MNTKQFIPAQDDSQCLYTADDVQNKLKRAIALVYKNDFYLIKNGAHERSITHRLAIYLEFFFPEWHVDCEYNLDNCRNDKLKRIENPCIECSKEECSERKRNMKNTTRIVYPDVIIHIRGQKYNLLAIEAKKNIQKKECLFDIQKLNQYKNIKGLHYRYTAFINFQLCLRNTILNLDFKPEGILHEYNQ